MKHIKKLAALALAIMMLMGLAIPAAAADGDTPATYSVTINNADGHTYKIYQIFKGDVSKNADDKYVLSNAKYGADYPDSQKVGQDVPLAELQTFTRDTIKESNLRADSGTAMKTNGNTATIEVLDAGYYMIVDVSTNLPKNESKSAIIFQVVENTTVNSKHTGTTIVKKVQDINDSTGEQPKDGESVWIDSADYDMGDTVPFKSTATFDGLSELDSYKVIFTDIMSPGLTYKGDMKVYIGNTECTGSFTISTETYTSALEAEAPYTGGTKITVSCDDIKALKSADDQPIVTGNEVTITLEYNATLNNDAKLGAPGNPNKIRVKAMPNGEGGHETPWDVNIVFTYKVITNKIDENSDALVGAEFALEKFVLDPTGSDEYKVNNDTTLKGKWVTKNVVKSESGDSFGFTGLDDGYYRLTETKTPDGYNTITPIEFTVTADHVIVSDSPVLNSLSGNATTGEIKFTASPDKSTLTTNVVNKSGVVLPETGGTGTTLFYIMGGAMVLVAAILLVTKKRMSNTD